MALQELLRTCKDQARILIYVWAFEQESEKIKRLITEEDEQDVFVPWKDKTSSLVVNRYYHLFKHGELERLIIETCPKVSIIRSGYDRDNWFCLIMKNT